MSHFRVMIVFLSWFLSSTFPISTFVPTVKLENNKKNIFSAFILQTSLQQSPTSHYFCSFFHTNCPKQNNVSRSANPNDSCGLRHSRHYETFLQSYRAITESPGLTSCSFQQLGVFVCVCVTESREKSVWWLRCRSHDLSPSQNNVTSLLRRARFVSMVLVLSGHNSTIKVLELYSSLTLRTQRFHLAWV